MSSENCNKPNIIFVVFLFFCFSIFSLNPCAGQDEAKVLTVTNEIYAIAWSFPAQGLVRAQEYLEKARIENSKLDEAHAHIFIADCYIMMGDFAPAIKNLLLAREICDEHGITYLDQRISRPYGRIYIELGDPEKAILHQKQGLLSTDEELETVITMHSLGEAYLEANKLDSALVIAEDLYERGGHLWAALPHLLGHVYLNSEKVEEALSVFKTKSGLTYDFDAIGNMLGIAEAHLRLGNLDSCRVYAMKGLSMASERQFAKYVKASANLLAESFMNLNDKEYIKYLLISEEANSQMYSKEKMNAFNDFIFSDEVRKRELKAEKLKFSNQKRTIIFFGILILLVLGAIVLWRNYAVKSKSHALLKKEKEKVELSIKQLKVTQEQLIEAEKATSKLQKQEADRLREMDSMKTQFFTNITHEFRTPLTVILGMNDNIEGHSYEKSLIKRNANSLLNLINQLMDLSKLDAGSLNIEMVNSDIVSYLQYLTESFYSLASDKKVGLSFETEKPEIIMDFDSDKIQHIIYNLLANAIKFTNPGGKVVLKVKVLQKDKQDWLEIKVKDTGIGIAPTELTHIFGRFYQSNNQSYSGGTGIGLTLTKELIELMGGEIKVKSESSWGTEFSVLLPVNQDSSNILQQIMEAQTFSATPELRGDDYISPSPDQVSGDNPLILVIEDNEGVISYIKSILAPSFNVLMAMNGQVGINMAIEHIPDLILTDVMMPEKNGFEVCDCLKKDERTSHIPIVMLTAKADKSSKIKGLEKGADAYLSKPFEKEELLVRATKLLELRKVLQAKYTSELSSPFDKYLNNPQMEDQFINKVRNYVEENINKVDLSISEASKQFFMSHTQFYRKVKALTGKTPSQFIRFIRIQKAIHLIKNTNQQIAEIAYQVGFNDPNYFSRIFKNDTGFSPIEMRTS